MYHNSFDNIDQIFVLKTLFHLFYARVFHFSLIKKKQKIHKENLALVIVCILGPRMQALNYAGIQKFKNELAKMNLQK